MTKTETIQQIRTILELLENGCGNHGCCIKRPKGMATNGPCHCGPQHISGQLLNLAIQVQSGFVWKQ